MVLKVDVPPTLVDGAVDDGFGPVADAFRANFAAGAEVGAACAVYVDGRPVVDLWGGYRDGVAKLPWRQDTMVTMFSTTKGVSSVALAHAHARGLLDYDATVASYWPEFGSAGKGGITVRQLLSHQAGLAVTDMPMDLDVLADPDRVAAAIDGQSPAWPAGTRHGYHGISLGWYESELLRRVDPKRRTIGRYFADEVATPLEAVFHIGLPAEVPAERVATIHGYKPAEMVLHLRELPPRFVLAFLDPRSATAKAFGNPRLLGVLDNYNRRDVLALESPASNGTGEARAVARIYSALACGGQDLGIGPQTLSQLEHEATPPTMGLHDEILHVDTAFSLGYIKPFPSFRFGGSQWRAFGTPGAGGSFGFADPEHRVGFCYAMNRSGFRLWDDERERSIRDALYRVLGGPPQRPDPPTTPAARRRRRPRR
ncbi:MAG: serine hydrolase domain-containing protein [Dermatophilaceae bacterium]